MKNILVIGCYHSLNSGVMAMVESLIQNFPDSTIYVASSRNSYEIDENRYSRYENVKLYSVEWLNSSYLNYLKLFFGLFGISLYKEFNAVSKDIDTIIDISGDSISNDYGTKSMFFSLFPALISPKNKKLIYAPQTLGPFKTILQKYLVKRVFKKAEGVFLREEISLKYLKHININLEKVHADLAFLLKPEFVDITLPDKTIGIGVSALIKKFGSNQSEQIFKQLIEKCLTKNYKVLLITHVATPHSNDVLFGKRIKESFFSSNDDVIFLGKNFISSEWKYIIGQCKAVISARMHPVVQAISQSITSVNLAYNHKSEGVVEKRFHPYGQVIHFADDDLFLKIDKFIEKIDSYNDAEEFKNMTQNNIFLAKEFVEFVNKLK